jgi:uncharacterized lipoprotein YddW (UPF0748 family)
MIKKITIFIFVVVFTFGIDAKAQDADGREMRAVWIATAKRIDYPKSLDSKKQRDEFVKLLDIYKKIGINAIFFQVRPAADAFFASKYEPWSEWLTGKQGQAPNPYYDPLEFMVQECHKRNMEFHAWFNPFRAVATISRADVAHNHISNTKPNWVFTYDINKYFNPGIPEVRDYVIKVISDVVQRYDIDGVHFDDYFYPYPVRGANKKIIPLPDNNTFLQYNTGFNNIEDWRRDNMSRFIKEMNISIKKIKPTMKFGISPSGIYRNKGVGKEIGSNTRGFEHYNYLYADVLKWLQEKWIDYVSPQIYWYIGHRAADYKTLVEWWSKHTYGRHLYIGHGIYMAKANAPDSHWRNPSELPDQVRMNRANPKVLGSIFYKGATFYRNPLGFNDSLRTNFYKVPVLPPTMPWLDNVLPPVPTDLFAFKLGKYYFLSWENPKTEDNTTQDTASYYAVYKFKGERIGQIKKENIYEIVNEPEILITRKRFAFFRKKYTFTVTAFDKLHNESAPCEPITIKLKR